MEVEVTTALDILAEKLYESSRNSEIGEIGVYAQDPQSGTMIVVTGKPHTRKEITYGILSSKLLGLTPLELKFHGVKMYEVKQNLEELQVVPGTPIVQTSLFYIPKSGETMVYLKKLDEYTRNLDKFLNYLALHHGVINTEELKASLLNPTLIVYYDSRGNVIKKISLKAEASKAKE